MVVMQQEVSSRVRITMLGRLLGSQIAAAMIILGVPALTPALREEFGLSRGHSGLLVAAVFLGVVIASWPAGKFVSAVGVRKSMILATLGLGLAFALTSAAWSYAAVLAILFIAGLFYAPVTPATNSGVVAWARPGFRTRSMAIKQMGVTAGASISAVLVPVLTAGFGWRVATVAVGAFVAIAGFAAANWFRRPEGARKASGDGRLENLPLVVTLGMAAFLLLLVQHCVATHYILALQDRGVGLVAAGTSLGLLQLVATGARFGWGWIADGPLRGRVPLAVLAQGAASAAVLTAMTVVDLAGTPALAAVLLGATTQAGNALIQLVLADSGGPAPAASTGLGMAIGFTGTVVGPPVFGFLADSWTYRSSWILVAVAALGAGLITWRAGRAIPY